MKMHLLALLTVGMVLSLAHDVSAQGDCYGGLVGHYYKDPDHWNGLWPDKASRPTAEVDPNAWTFREYSYSRVEPVVNHLFIRNGWFSVRWVGYFDPSVVEDLPELQQCTIGGGLNINPANRTDGEFLLVKPDGTSISRRDLTKRFPGYNGPAVRLMLRPKGNGNQNGLTVNGRPFVVENALRYDIQSTNMTVRLFFDRTGLISGAKGSWWIEIEAKDAVIVVSAGTSITASTGGSVTIESVDEKEYAGYFEILADDGCRLVVDGKTLIDDWQPRWEEEEAALRKSGSVSLKKGRHRIVVEYFQGQSLEDEDDEDPIRLFWTCPALNIFRQVAPAESLSHTAKDLTSTER